GCGRAARRRFGVDNAVEAVGTTADAPGLLAAARILARMVAAGVPSRGRRPRSTAAGAAPCTRVDGYERLRRAHLLQCRSVRTAAVVHDRQPAESVVARRVWATARNDGVVRPAL